MFDIQFEGESVRVRSVLSPFESLELEFADDLSSEDLNEVSFDDCEVMS